MNDTLHVIDTSGPGEPMLPALIRCLQRERSQVALLDGSAGAAEARRAGLHDFHAIAPPLGRAELAGPALRALARRLQSRDIVAWSPAAAAGARWTGRNLRAVVATRPERCGPVAQRAVRSLIARGAVAFVGHDAADAWAHTPDTGCTIAEEAPCAVTDPASARRDARLGWGVDEQLVIGLVDSDGAGGPTVDGYFVSFVVGCLAMTGRDMLAIAPRGARGLERGKRQMERHGDRWRVIPERRPAWRWIPGCDVLMAFGPGGVAHGWAAQTGATLLPVGPEWETPVGQATTRRPREAAAAILKALDARAESGRNDGRPARGDIAAALAALRNGAAIRAERRSAPSMSPA